MPFWQHLSLVLRPHFGALAPLSRPLACFQAHSSLRPQQLVAHHPQIGQRKQRLELQRVLLQPPVAHLGVSGAQPVSQSFCAPQKQNRQRQEPVAVCFGSDRERCTYFPALSALRLAALGSTTALNFAPATNFGTVLAGILSAAPVDGFLPVRAARLADLKVPKPTS